MSGGDVFLEITRGGCVGLQLDACDPVIRTGEYRQTGSYTDDIMRASVVGLLLGAGVGGLIGRAVKRWQTVELDEVMIRDGNLAVSLHIQR